MLFGEEWNRPEPVKRVKKPRKPRPLPVVPEWIAELLVCENCGAQRVAGGSGMYAVCQKPGCSKMIQRVNVKEKIEKTRAALVESDPDTPELAQCLRLAWKYLRGRMRRGDL